MMRMLRDFDIVENGKILEETNVLERASDASLGDRMGPQSKRRFSRDLNTPCGRTIDAGEDIEHGRLSRAVRADQADEFAGKKREGEVVDRPQAAKLHRDVLCGEESGAWFGENGWPIFQNRGQRHVCERLPAPPEAAGVKRLRAVRKAQRKRSGNSYRPNSPCGRNNIAKIINSE